jgi:hypothetical protein
MLIKDRSEAVTQQQEQPTNGPTRRIRPRLGISEIDATWIFTGTGTLFRFNDGRWEQGVGVYYGHIDRWSNYGMEPTAYCGHVFVEVLPGQQVDDPEVCKIISSYQDSTEQQRQAVSAVG